MDWKKTILGIGIKELKKRFTDNTKYTPDFLSTINTAIELYDEGDYEKSLKILSSVAKEIDCEAFHRYGLMGAYHWSNKEAREQYNRICLYIAKIYKHKGDSSQVSLWADNLAYIRDYSLDEWHQLLTEDEYQELRELFRFRDINYESTADVWNDYNTNHYDY